MSLPKATLIELMAYADGEVNDPAERARIEKLVAQNADARRFVESLGVLGDIVPEAYVPPPAAATAGLTDAIMAAVERDRKENGAPISLEAARERKARRFRVGVVAAGIVALAAGVALVAKPTGQNGPGAPGPFASASRDPGAALAKAAAGVDVDQVDSNHDVEVFYLPSQVETNASSVVVWIDDKPSTP